MSTPRLFPLFIEIFISIGQYLLKLKQIKYTNLARISDQLIEQELIPKGETLALQDSDFRTSWGGKSQHVIDSIGQLTTGCEINLRGGGKL